MRFHHDIQGIDTFSIRAARTIEKDSHNCKEEIVSPGFVQYDVDAFVIN